MPFHTEKLGLLDALFIAVQELATHPDGAGQLPIALMKQDPDPCFIEDFPRAGPGGGLL